jgi:hypothetical protein
MGMVCENYKICPILQCKHYHEHEEDVSCFHICSNTNGGIIGSKCTNKNLTESEKRYEFIKQRYINLVKDWIKESSSSSLTDDERFIYEKCARELHDLNHELLN